MSSPTATLCSSAPPTHEAPASLAPSSPSLSLAPSPTRSSSNSHSYPPQPAPIERPVPPLEPPDRGKAAYLFLLGAFSGASPSTLLVPPPTSSRLDSPRPSLTVETVIWGLPSSYGLFLEHYQREGVHGRAASSSLLPLVGTVSSGAICALALSSFFCFFVRELTHRRARRPARPAYQLHPQPETALAPQHHPLGRPHLLAQSPPQLVRDRSASNSSTQVRECQLTRVTRSPGSCFSRRASSTRSAAPWPTTRRSTTCRSGSSSAEGLRTASASLGPPQEASSSPSSCKPSSRGTAPRRLCRLWCVLLIFTLLSRFLCIALDDELLTRRLALAGRLDLPPPRRRPSARPPSASPPAQRHR